MKISKINNNIKYINTSNKIFYNYISHNVHILEDKLTKNISWKTPYGSIYIDLTENTIINYVKFNNIDITNKIIHIKYIYIILKKI